VNDLTFEKLQHYNHMRGLEWTKGEEGPGLEFNVIELGGEGGVLQNEIKKMLRFKHGMAGGKDCLNDVADELADVVICCSILANTLNLDLGHCVVDKFNKTSDKHGFSVKL
jgi:NTP pyrophosphatase (non-canonical NTP hydrolase)